MTDAEKKHTDTVVFKAPESGLYKFSDGKITLTKRIGENCIYCSELCSDLMRDEHRIKTLEARVEKLKRLMLLTDPVVQNIGMNWLSAIQWNEYIKAFPEEADVKWLIQKDGESK